MPDPIIREIPLIERYARHNNAEDFRFRTFLKTRLNLSNTELDAIVKETTDTIWQQIDCTTCAHCCRTLQIEVDNKDLRLLAQHTGLTLKQFTKQYVQTDAEGVKHFGAPPCPFLGDDNRCTVYEARPQACRDFPYLHSAGFRQRTLTFIERSASCPIVFNVWNTLKTRLGFRRRK